MNDRSEKRIELILIGNCLYLYFVYLERDGFLLLGFCDTFFSSSFLFSFRRRRRWHSVGFEKLIIILLYCVFMRCSFDFVVAIDYGLVLRTPFYMVFVFLVFWLMQ